MCVVLPSQIASQCSSLVNTTLFPPTEQLHALFTLSRLRVLDLSHLFITNDLAQHFSALPNLSELNVGHCRDLGNQGALTILRTCPNLQVFIVTGCPLSTLGMLRLHRTRRGLRTWTITEVATRYIVVWEIGN